MITFSWEISPDERFIKWEAIWDGKNKNDNLLMKNWDDPPHPLYRTLDYEQDLSMGIDPSEVMKAGDIVSNNEATQALVNLIDLSIKDPEKFKSKTGNTHPYGYRANLIGALSYLWD